MKKRGDILEVPAIDLGDDVAAHLLYYPLPQIEQNGGGPHVAEPRGFVLDHPNPAMPSGRCGGRVTWTRPDGTPGKFTLLSLEPLTIREPITCRCGLCGHVLDGRFTPTVAPEMTCC